MLNPCLKQQEKVKRDKKEETIMKGIILAGGSGTMCE